MEWLALEIISIFVAKGVDYFTGILGSIRKLRLKNQLKKRLSSGILKNYGNEVFYNDLDAFLMQNKVISKTIENCYDASPSEYKSQKAYVEFYIRMFEEKYPQYIAYHMIITTIVQQCYDIVFQTLNSSSNDSVRIVCNITKELSGELLYKLNDMHDDISIIKKNVEVLVSQSQGESATIDLTGYFEYVVHMYPEYSQTDYICRKVYPDREPEKRVTAYSTLLDQRKVLLLGEAGYGKTFEAISLLRNICIEESDQPLVPVYLPLSEYGILYTSIREGATLKLSSFIHGDANDLITQWLDEQKLVLILDGVDDIVEDSDRTKFILEVKDLVQRYNSVFCFVTARRNRYHDELNGFCVCSLTGINEAMITSKLRNSGIRAKVPRTYYQLFANPLFLEAGIMVLKDNPQQSTFNRSTLFEKLIYLLYEGRDKQKGIYVSQALCCTEFISLIGEFSYNSFYQPSYSYVGFEEQIVKLIPHMDKAKIVSAVIACDIFKTRENISFSHKLFKEFCTAYYMNSALPYSNNIELYDQLIQKEEWKEVFIFIAGLFGDVQKQDEFLDFVLQRNLRLYIDCVNAKSDLCDSDFTHTHISLAMRYLSQIHKTYTYIVTNYFGAIAHLFDPMVGRSCSPGNKVCIRGTIDSERKRLTYWFDLLPQENQAVKIIPEEDLAEHFKRVEKKAVLEGKTIKTHCTGIEGDTSRSIAIKHIRNELRSIIDKKRLTENRYLLCERVTKCKKQLKALKESHNLVEMQEYVDQQIKEATQKVPNLAGFHNGNVDMFAFQGLLTYLNSQNINYDECVLPDRDQDPFENGNGWTWDCYSEQCKIDLVSKYFYFSQVAYKEMVEQNFPRLRDDFSLYRDFPYQMVVYLNLQKENTAHDYSSDPSIQYYHIASLAKEIPYPDIRLVDEEKDHNSVFDEIMRSYEKQDRTAHRISITSTGFLYIIASHKSNSNGPLSDYVYEMIKESLENVVYQLQ